MTSDSGRAEEEGDEAVDGEEGHVEAGSALSGEDDVLGDKEDGDEGSGGHRHAGGVGWLRWVGLSRTLFLR